MLAVTVDIEDWYHLIPITGAPSSRYTSVDYFFSEWHSRYDYLSEPTKRTLEILDNQKIKATFFVVADVVEHYPGLVEEIAEKGHEIACHGLHHACKINPKTKEPLMSMEEFKNRTFKAKSILENASGQKVIGYRAPNAYIAGWMIDVLEELGFEYDSSVSINSIYNKTDSPLKGVSTIPYYPKRNSLEPGGIRKIMEIPWPYLKLGLKFPTGGGPVLRFSNASYILLGLKQSLKRGNTVFYFHPIDISRESFPLTSSLQQHLFWAIKGDRVRKRIHHIITCINTEMGTCRDMVTGL